MTCTSTRLRSNNGSFSTIVIDIDPHWVFHLATYGAYSSQSDVQTIVTTNYNGTVNLVEACLETGFEAFVNAGSSSEYGYKDHAPVESELPEPNSHYAATKAAADALLPLHRAESAATPLDAASLLRVRPMGGPDALAPDTCRVRPAR